MRPDLTIPRELTRNERRVLAFLEEASPARDGAHYAADIARGCGMHSTSAVVALRRLAGRGRVVRHDDGDHGSRWGLA